MARAGRKVTQFGTCNVSKGEKTGSNCCHPLSMSRVIAHNYTKFKASFLKIRPFNFFCNFYEELVHSKLFGGPIRNHCMFK